MAAKRKNKKEGREEEENAEEKERKEKGRGGEYTCMRSGKAMMRAED